MLGMRSVTTARDRGVSRPTCVVVLAAGEGTRMRSARPKPLHHLCGRADGALRARRRRTRERARDGRRRRPPRHVGGKGAHRRRPRRRHPSPSSNRANNSGTGHAVSVALPTIDDAIGATDGDVLIMPGDTPLLRRSSVARLLDVHRESPARPHRARRPVSMTPRDTDDSSTPRTARSSASSKSATRAPRSARSTRSTPRSWWCAQSLLGPALRRVGRQNAQNEYYLTDLIAVLHEMGHVTPALHARGRQRGGRRQRPAPTGPRREGAARTDQRAVAARGA